MNELENEGRAGRARAHGRGAPIVAALVALLVAAVWPATVASGAARSVGIAPFERVAAEGTGVPDIAGRLAQRLGTKGLSRVVGPLELGAAAAAEPSPADVSRWAGQGGVSYIVVGRTTRLGNAVSVTARLLDPADGEALGTPMVEEAGRPEELGRAIESLADQVISRMEASPSTAAPATAAAAGAAAATGAAAAATPAVAARPPSPSQSSGGPISIRADSLEVLDGANKKMLFRGNVRAKQEGFIVYSSRLEASYPKGSSQPDRMIATGSVRIEEDERTARCGKATYYRKDRKVVCVEKAAVVQKCDEVRGDKITFYLDRDVLKVEGGADVSLDSEDPSCESDS